MLESSHYSRSLLAILLLSEVAHADHSSRLSFTFNSKTVADVRVGAETKTVRDEVVIPPDNDQTELDERDFRIDVEYATVFNSVTEKDYLYFINTLKIPKPPAKYEQFTVMLYTQIITSDADPISHATTFPDFETVSLSTPFYGESTMDKQLWMLNQYKYTQQSDVEKLFRATGTWNSQL